MDAVQLAMEKNLLQDPPAGQQSSGHLYLVIQGTFCDIARYAGTVDSSRLPICCASFHEDHFRCNAKCAVSGSECPVTASHLIPRCIGSDGARDVVERFAGVTENTSIRKFDPRIGITFFKGVGHWAKLFQAGFYGSTTLR